MMAWAVTDFPEPDSPSTASVSPCVERVAHAVDRLRHAVAGVELDLQVLHVEQQRPGRGVGLARLRCR